MFYRSFLRLGVSVAGFALAIGSIHVSAQQDSNRRGRKYKAPPLSSRSKSLFYAMATASQSKRRTVIFHPIEGDKDKGVMELKTN